MNKRMCIRNLLKSWKVDIVALQETKLEQISRNIVQNFVEWSTFTLVSVWF
jgi:exonuclease III